MIYEFFLDQVDTEKLQNQILYHPIISTRLDGVTWTELANEQGINLWIEFGASLSNLEAQELEIVVNTHNPDSSVYESNWRVKVLDSTSSMVLEEVWYQHYDSQTGFSGLSKKLEYTYSSTSSTIESYKLTFYYQDGTIKEIRQDSSLILDLQGGRHLATYKEIRESDL